MLSATITMNHLATKNNTGIVASDLVAEEAKIVDSKDGLWIRDLSVNFRRL